MKNCNYKDYIRIRKAAEINSSFYYDTGEVGDNILTEEEFDFLNEVLQ